MKPQKNWILPFLEKIRVFLPFIHRFLFPNLFLIVLFSFFWTTSDPKILDYTGAIGEDVPSKGASVTLRCQLSIEEETLSWQKELYVYPEKLSKEKSLNASIQKAVTNDSSSNPTLALPDSIDGQHLFFYKEHAKTGLFVCIFFSLLGFLLLPLKRQKEQEKNRKAKSTDAKRLSRSCQ